MCFRRVCAECRCWKNRTWDQARIWTSIGLNASKIHLSTESFEALPLEQRIYLQTQFYFPVLFSGCNPGWISFAVMPHSTFELYAEISPQVERKLINEWMNEWMNEWIKVHLHVQCCSVSFPAWEGLRKFDTSAWNSYPWSIYCASAKVRS